MATQPSSDAQAQSDTNSPTRFAPSRPFRTLVVLDIFAVALSPFLALLLRFGRDVPPLHWEPYVVFLPVLVTWRLLAFHIAGAYDLRNRLTMVDHLFAALGGSLISVLPGYLTLMFIQAYYWPEMRLSRLVSGLDILILFVWFWASRSLFLEVLRRRGYRVRVLVASTSVSGCAVADELERHAPALLEIVRLPHLAAAQSEDDDRSAAAWKSQIATGDIHRVVVAESAVSFESLRDILALSDQRGIELLLYPDIGLTLLAGSRVTSLSGMPLLSLRPAFLDTPYGYGKRLMDLAAASLLMAMTLPLQVVAALAIRMDSPGPALFKQCRVGRRGRPFHLYKLRTMRSDAEHDSGPVLSQVSDPRITRVGRVLRRFRIDELPQLVNVLQGHMSLVGPRPERPEFVDVYQAENPLYERRLFLRPGLTGLAQVHGRYDSDYVDKLRFDLVYLNSVSLVTDLRIILATVRTVLTGRGAL